jgi:short-subunit dehydrogenase
MPFLKSTNYAADQIYNGLIKKNNFEIIFPLPIKIIYKLIQILPNKLYNYLISKSVNR